MQKLEFEQWTCSDEDLLRHPARHGSSTDTDICRALHGWSSDPWASPEWTVVDRSNILARSSIWILYFQSNLASFRIINVINRIQRSKNKHTKLEPRQSVWKQYLSTSLIVRIRPNVHIRICLCKYVRSKEQEEAQREKNPFEFYHDVNSGSKVFWRLSICSKDKLAEIKHYEFLLPKSWPYIQICCEPYLHWFTPPDPNVSLSNWEFLALCV